MYRCRACHRYTAHVSSTITICASLAGNGLSQVWLALLLACQQVATVAYLQCGLPLLTLLLGRLARLLQLGFQGAAAGRLARSRLSAPVWADVLRITGTCTQACMTPQLPGLSTLDLASLCKYQFPELLPLQKQPAADRREPADRGTLQER